jgi:uncharacterized protein
VRLEGRDVDGHHDRDWALGFKLIVAEAEMTRQQHGHGRLASARQLCGVVAFALLVALFSTPSTRAQVAADALLKRLSPQGLVSDFASLISDSDEQTILQRLRVLEDQTGAQVAVVTIESLEGGQIDDFANKLFTRWGIGQKGRDNGVLILVALRDRKARIEVGKGLEGILPDALAGRILDEQLFPAFRQSKFSEGLRACALRVAEIVERNQPPSPQELTRPTRPQLSFWARVGLALFFTPFVLAGGFAIGLAIGMPWKPAFIFPKIFAALWGAIFGGVVLAIAFSQLGWFSSWVLTLLGLSMLGVGCLAGRNIKLGKRAYAKRSRSAPWWTPVLVPSGGWGDWSNSSSGGGFGGGGSSWGGFGGGSSGGGGASGGW